MKFKRYAPLAVAVCTLPLIGFLCDVGTNPLLFDGSPLTATIEIQSSTTTYANSETIDLSSAISKITDDIDSVNVINITVRIINHGSAESGTRISGKAGFNGTPFLTMTDVAVDSFSTERSIFRLPPGFSLRSDGVRQIIQVVKNATENMGPSSATVNVAGTSTNPLDCTMILKLYTQVFTRPPGD